MNLFDEADCIRILCKMEYDSVRRISSEKNGSELQWDVVQHIICGGNAKAVSFAGKLCEYDMMNEIRGKNDKITIGDRKIAGIGF